MSMILVVDSKGRVILPKDVRRVLGIEQGGKVLLTLEGERATLSSLDEELRRFRGQWKVQGRSLVDELLQERRDEARKEK
jgi:AbrB family looped-hinge helix DNA binding protein